MTKYMGLIIFTGKLLVINSRFSRQVKDPEQFLNEDSENMIGNRSKESRIVTPSRTILPPHTPHFIYFNPADTLSSVQSVHRISPSPVRLTQAGDNPTSTPSSCLTDPEIQVCEFDKTSYPATLVDSVLNTFHQEMRTLLKYVKPSMIRE